MKKQINIRIDVETINLQKIKEEHGTILPIQNEIRENLQNENNRELFDYIIKQYESWIEQLTSNLFEDGYRCALTVLQQVNKSLFD